MPPVTAKTTSSTPYAIGTGRKNAHSGRRHAPRAPMAARRAPSGLSMRTWKPISSIVPPGVRYSSRMSPASSSCGQPCWACQTRLGSHRATATAAAAHAQGERRWCRVAGVTAMPTTRPAARKPTRCLFSSPMPRVRPTASQRRGRSCCRVATTRRTTTVQASRSGVAVDSRCPMARTPAPVPVTTAASSCARAVAAEGAREVGGQQHDDARHHRGQRPQREHRAGRQSVGRGGDQRGERRLVGIAPLRVVAGRDEVELVPVRSVPAAQREQHPGRQRGDHQGAGGQPSFGGWRGRRRHHSARDRATTPSGAMKPRLR